ncbi:DUF4942 domain-containing protein [[Brevibacterium] frigoritolerans]|nr:DUF4942 domain-containing protein [Peribacillus frigoritolerans]
MFNNTEFYPTPKELIAKMVADVNFNEVKSVLEPSAGKGDIAKYIKEAYEEFNTRRYRSHFKPIDMEVIEIDENLRHILKGENFRIVHNDFLTFHTYKNYDLVILNPPFSNGDKHLLKAIQLQENGGQVVCLLNAETLKNPYSNTRKDLIKKLEEYEADVEFLDGSFAEAERKTLVEVALIKITIPEKENSTSVIIENLKREEKVDYNEYSGNHLAFSDKIKAIVQKYNFEAKAGVQLINEYYAMQPYLEFNPVLSLIIAGDTHATTQTEKIDSYIKTLRYKYWATLFRTEQFTDLLTSKLRREYFKKIQELEDYDFSLYNIFQIQEDINKSILQSVEDTLVDLFEEFSHKHHWHPETSNNTHYYDGWKTNKSWKINKKVIILLNAYSNYEKKFDCDYNVIDKLTDIEKSISYLDRGIFDHKELKETLVNAVKMEKVTEKKQTKIPLKYFKVTFYKKGTCHIEFIDQDLLAKFNLYGSRKKGWLPPSYASKNYDDMTQEEKVVIDNYQGKADYEKVMANKAYYLYDQFLLDEMNKNSLLYLGETIQEEQNTNDFEPAATIKSLDDDRLNQNSLDKKPLVIEEAAAQVVQQINVEESVEVIMYDRDNEVIPQDLPHKAVLTPIEIGIEEKVEQCTKNEELVEVYLPQNDVQNRLDPTLEALITAPKEHIANKDKMEEKNEGNKGKEKVIAVKEEAEFISMLTEGKEEQLAFF